MNASVLFYAFSLSIYIILDLLKDNIKSNPITMVLDD